MTLDDADYLLAQWAQWAASPLRRLDYSASRWQQHYRSGFADEAPVAEIEAGDDIVMLDVDSALAVLKLLTPEHFHVLRGRYLLHHNYTFIQLDAAKRAFIVEYQSPIDIESERRLNITRGARSR
jgi:hypothetical protein